MSLGPISVKLSKFENIEILRHEIEEREGELGQTEKEIREILWEYERNKYLKGLHPFFQRLKDPEKLGKLPELHSLREGLNSALEVLKDHLKNLEVEMQGKTPPQEMLAKSNLPSPRNLGTKRRFESFDDFRQSQGGAT